LPIVIHVDARFGQLPSVTDVISVLSRRDRVCQILFVGVPGSLLKEVATTTTTSGPFPALIELRLASREEGPPIVPDSFLGGSAPRLQSLYLSGISFPATWKLLLSTRDLVTLSISLDFLFSFFPPSGYISPKAMVPILSALTKLETLVLDLHFELPFETHRAGQRPPALARVVLPSLTNFSFDGYSGYLWDFVSRIDAPLDSITLTFDDEIVVSNIPLLRDFIDRTKIFNAPHRAETSFSNALCRFSLFRRKGDVDFNVLSLEIPCFNYTLTSQLSSLAQACSLLLPPLPSLELLGIRRYKCEPLPPQSLYGVHTTQWTALLRPFVTVKDLAVGEPLISPIASTLQRLVGKPGTEILPALQNIFLESCQSSGPVPKGIAEFMAAREHSGRPVMLHHR
jgi:hypothetical protein